MTTHDVRTLAPTMERLRRLSALEHDWDSYGGEPPTAAAVEQAKRVVRDIVGPVAAGVGRRIEAATVVARGDGGVLLEWRGGDAALEIHVEPDGSLGYLLDENEGAASRYTEKEHASWNEVATLLADVIAR